MGRARSRHNPRSVPLLPQLGPSGGGKLQVHPVTTWCLAPTSVPAGCARPPAVFPEPRALRVQGEGSARRKTVGSSGSARGGSGRRALGVIPLTSVPWRAQHVFCHPNRTIGLSDRLTPMTANGTKRHQTLLVLPQNPAANTGWDKGLSGSCPAASSARCRMRRSPLPISVLENLCAKPRTNRARRLARNLVRGRSAEGGSADGAQRRAGRYRAPDSA